MRIVPIIIGALFLAGCNTTKPIEITTTPAQLNISQPADPRPPNVKGVQWRVVTKDTLDQFISEQSKAQDNSNPVFVAISMRDYQTLSTDLAELRRYIDQQRSVIVYYRNATAPR
jgi:uncharacterized lipoprotein YajG